MNERVKLIIFDFDGTIVDSKEDIAASANHVLALRGLPPKDTEVVAGYIGDGIHVLLGRVLETSDKREIEEAVRVFREHYWDHCLDRTREYPGVRGALERLRTRTMAIVTNKPKNFTDKILEGLGLVDYFAAVVGGDGPYPKKPAPDAFEAVLEELGVDPRAALVVGDSPNDINGGRAAGCMTCAVTYGLSDRKALEAASPDMILDTMEELPERID